MHSIYMPLDMAKYSTVQKANPTKCDLEPSGCMQCLRKGITCHGYRDVSQLRVRDETVKVIERNSREKPSRSAQQQLTEASGSKQQMQAETGLVQANVLSLDPTATAISYFMQTYIFSSSFQEYLPELSLSKKSPDDPLPAAIRAASLTTFAMHAGHPMQIAMARKEYSVALARTNKALARSETAVRDTTLASVLLLGLYEAIIFQGGKSPEQWMVHTSGALRLLVLRGMQNVASRTALLLYAQTCSSVRASCIQASIPVPADFLQLNEALAPILETSSPAVKLVQVTLGGILDTLAGIRARIPSADGSVVVAEALALDDKIQLLIFRLQDVLPYTLRSVEELPSWAYNGIGHKYLSSRSARLWNSVRLVRLFINHLIWDASFRQEASSAPRCLDGGLDQQISRNAHLAATAMGSDILASVPDFLGARDGAGRCIFMPSARSLAWPLAFIAKSELLPPHAKGLAQSLLLLVGEHLHFPQIVNAPAQAGEEEDW